MRDLMLILLGVALTRKDRDRVLSKFPEGLLSAEFNTLLGAIRTKQPRGLVEWLRERGVTLEKGEDVISRVIEECHVRAQKEFVARKMRRLEFSRLDDLASITEQVESLLKTLKGDTHE